MSARGIVGLLGLEGKNWHKLTQFNCSHCSRRQHCNVMSMEIFRFVFEILYQRTNEPMGTGVSFSPVARGYQDHGLHVTLVRSADIW